MEGKGRYHKLQSHKTIISAICLADIPGRFSQNLACVLHLMT